MLLVAAHLSDAVQVSVCMRCSGRPRRSGIANQTAASERFFAVLRFAIQVSSRLTVLQLAACGVLVSVCGASACSTYSTDLLNGSGLANGGNTPNTQAGASGVAGNAITAGGGSAGTDTAHAGSDTSGDGGVGGDGTVVGGGGGAKGGTGGTVGGASGVAGGGVAGFGTTGGATTVSSDLIDDFEDGDKLINIINSPRRDGIWDTNNDGTVGGTEAPAPGMFVPAALDANTASTAAAAPYAGDTYAAHLTGKGFTNFGAYMNVSMRAVAVFNDTPYYDATGYKGISFIAKVGSTASAIKAMRVRFVSGDTDPRGKKCMTTGVQTGLCYNHYYASVTLTPAWKLYQINFSDFVQGADGMINPSIDTKEMYGMEFYFAPSTTFDLWLDDLTFFK